jgi:Protein of unknown function (DUF3307)
VIGEALLAHLVGDYLFQTEWMATRKVERWWPAIVHGVMYCLPFLVLTRSAWALLVIGGTHVVLDRYRLAKRVIWLRSFLGPRRYRPAWREAAANSGFGPGTPAGLAMALMIVNDNVMHMLINATALTWLR